MDVCASPLKVALTSVRDNFVPMVVLWLFAAMLVFAYYCIPGCAEALGPLARWQCRSGSRGAFLGLAFFCGIVPGLFFLAVQSVRPPRPVLTMLAQTVWGGLWGVAGNWLYSAQSVWFGGNADWKTLLLKTAVDQFIWTPFILSPFNAAFFFWLGRDFSFRRVAAELPRHFVRAVFLPNLISNWLVWIPVLCVVYAFPLPLQIHLSGVASAFWALLCLRIGRWNEGTAAEPLRQ